MPGGRLNVITSIRPAHTARSILLASLVVAVTLLGVQSSTAATTPQKITACGQLITRPTAYLANSLVCSVGFTINPMVDSDGIPTVTSFSIDLKGHRLQGKGTGHAFTVNGDAATFLAFSLSNGRIDHWGVAVISGFTGVTASRVTIDHNATGIATGKGTAAVTDSTLSDNTLGSGVFDGSLTFTRTVFLHNTVGSEVQTGFSGSGTYTTSQFIQNGIGVKVDSDAEATVTSSQFIQNTTGVSATGDGTAYLTSNLFVLNRDGIYLATPEIAPPSELKSNLAYSNTGYGFYAPGSVDLGGNRGSGNGKLAVGVRVTA